MRRKEGLRGSTRARWISLKLSISCTKTESSSSVATMRDEDAISRKSMTRTVVAKRERGDILSLSLLFDEEFEENSILRKSMTLNSKRFFEVFLCGNDKYELKILDAVKTTFDIQNIIHIKKR